METSQRKQNENDENENFIPVLLLDEIRDSLDLAQIVRARRQALRVMGRRLALW